MFPSVLSAQVDCTLLWDSICIIWKMSQIGKTPETMRTIVKIPVKSVLKSEPEPVRKSNFFFIKKKSKKSKNPLELKQLEDPNDYETFTRFRENYALSNDCTLGSESCEILEQLEQLEQFWNNSAQKLSFLKVLSLCWKWVSRDNFRFLIEWCYSQLLIFTPCVRF